MRLTVYVGSLFPAVLLIAACATSKTSTVGIMTTIDHPIDTIAMDPNGGLLADAIGVALSNYGFNVIDTNTMTRLMFRLNLNEIELTEPQNLSMLQEQGIDAFLSVKSAAGYDGLPQSASVRMNSTHNGKIIVGVSWQNGWGGQAGSIADRAMRKGITEAASEIATALVNKIKR